MTDRAPSATRPHRLPRDAALAGAVMLASGLAWMATGYAHVAADDGWHGPLAPVDGWPQLSGFVCAAPPSTAATLAHRLQWLAGWTLMVVAMMLPPALPFLRRIAAVDTDRRAAVIALAAMSFVTTWALAGALLVAAGTGLALLAQRWQAFAATPALASGIAALAVGAFQFSPLKTACLTACRRPDALILMGWRHHAPLRAAAAIALRYGAVCIGCCLPLMVLTTAVGAFALPLMVVAAIAMLLERTVPAMRAVRAIVALQAALSLAVGALLLAGVLAPGLGVPAAPLQPPVVP